jgi:TonB family protein
MPRVRFLAKLRVMDKLTSPSARRAVFLISAFVLAAGASAASPWVNGLKEVDQKLRAQQWDEAGKMSQKMARQIAGDAGRDKDTAYSIAVASVFRAIAEAGQGHQDEALWYWDTALNLVPGIATTDLTPYGAPAAELKKETLRTAHQAPKKKGDLWTVDEREIPLDKLERPKVISQVRPDYPSALVQEGVPGKVVVEAIIDTDGRLRRPLILSAQGGGPGMKYAALEAVDQWRFEPARLEGKPVAVYYVLTINFEVGHRR